MFISIVKNQADRGDKSHIINQRLCYPITRPSCSTNRKNVGMKRRLTADTHICLWELQLSWDIYCIRIIIRGEKRRLCVSTPSWFLGFSVHVWSEYRVTAAGYKNNSKPLVIVIIITTSDQQKRSQPPSLQSGWEVRSGLSDLMTAEVTKRKIQT